MAFEETVKYLKIEIYLSYELAWEGKIPMKIEFRKSSRVLISVPYMKYEVKYR